MGLETRLDVIRDGFPIGRRGLAAGCDRLPHLPDRPIEPSCEVGRQGRVDVESLDIGRDGGHSPGAHRKCCAQQRMGRLAAPNRIVDSHDVGTEPPALAVEQIEQLALKRLVGAGLPRQISDVQDRYVVREGHARHVRSTPPRGNAA